MALEYFDPPNIDKSILRKAGINETILVPIKPSSGALPQNCLNNVNTYIDRFGGEVQLGWIFSIMGNVALKLTAHAVVKTKEQKFICITPNLNRKDNVRFCPDNGVSSLIVNNFLPQKLIPLISSKVLDEYLALEREMNDLRLSNLRLVSQKQVQEIQLKAQLLYPSILHLAMGNTSQKDYCFCGSYKKRCKCCK
ncbi:hypothetical protein GCM10009128_06130 [Psychrosphaera haliotis]|uniref:hypothetical protein n=1 Tax=Psychrosphaera haliotis TaxID=555083 RepID=UPI0031E3B88A